MDDKAVDAVPAANPPDGAVLEIEGVEVASFTAVVGRLCVDYPDVASNRIETILLREWDAFTAGRPPVVPRRSRPGCARSSTSSDYVGRASGGPAPSLRPPDRLAALQPDSGVVGE